MLSPRHPCLGLQAWATSSVRGNGPAARGAPFRIGGHVEQLGVTCSPYRKRRRKSRDSRCRSVARRFETTAGTGLRSNRSPGGSQAWCDRVSPSIHRLSRRLFPGAGSAPFGGTARPRWRRGGAALSRSHGAPPGRVVCPVSGGSRSGAERGGRRAGCAAPRAGQCLDGSSGSGASARMARAVHCSLVKPPSGPPRIDSRRTG